MSNCVVASGDYGTPLDIVTKHGVEGYNHLAHHCDDDDLSLFAGGGEAFGEGFEMRIVSTRAQSGHVEDVTHGHATPVDTSMSFKLSAVEVIGRETDEGSDLLAIELTELGQRGKERIGECRADAGRGNEQVVAVGQAGICADEFGEALVEETNIGLQPHQPALAKASQHGVLEMSRLVHRRGMLITQLAPHGYDFGEAFKGLIASHNTCRHGRDVFCDQSSVETVILSQDTAGAGKLTKLVRIDTPHGQSCCKQRTDDAALVTSARLKANRSDWEWAESCNQLCPPRRVVADRTL
jgi:hypothetical protein